MNNVSNAALTIHRTENGMTLALRGVIHNTPMALTWTIDTKHGGIPEHESVDFMWDDRVIDLGKGAQRAILRLANELQSSAHVDTETRTNLTAEGLKVARSIIERAFRAAVHATKKDWRVLVVPKAKMEAGDRPIKGGTFVVREKLSNMINEVTMQMVKRYERVAFRPFAEKYDVHWVALEHGFGEEGFESLVRQISRFMNKARGMDLVATKATKRLAFTADSAELVRRTDLGEDIVEDAKGALVRLGAAILGRVGSVALHHEYRGIVAPSMVDGQTTVNKDITGIFQVSSEIEVAVDTFTHLKGMERKTLRGELEMYERTGQIGKEVPHGAAGTSYVLALPGSESVGLDIQTLAFTAKDQGHAELKKEAQKWDEMSFTDIVGNELTEREMALYEAGMSLGLLLDEECLYTQAKNFKREGYRSHVLGAGVASCTTVEPNISVRGMQDYDELVQRASVDELASFTDADITSRFSGEFVVRHVGGKLEIMEWLLASNEVKFSRQMMRSFKAAHGRKPEIGEEIFAMRQPALPNATAIRPFTYAGMARFSDGSTPENGIFIAAQSTSWAEMNGDFDGDSAVFFFEELFELGETDDAALERLEELKTGETAKARFAGNKMLWTETVCDITTGITSMTGPAVSQAMKAWELDGLTDALRFVSLKPIQGSIYAQKRAVAEGMIYGAFEQLRETVKSLKSAFNMSPQDATLIDAMAWIKEANGVDEKRKAWDALVKYAKQYDGGLNGRAMASYITALGEAAEKSGMLRELKGDRIAKTTRDAAADAVQERLDLFAEDEEKLAQLKTAIRRTKQLAEEWNQTVTAWSSAKTDLRRESAPQMKARLADKVERLSDRLEEIRYQAECMMERGLLDSSQAVASFGAHLLVDVISPAVFRRIGLQQEMLEVDCYIKPFEDDSIDELIKKAYTPSRDTLRQARTADMQLVGIEENERDGKKNNWTITFQSFERPTPSLDEIIW